MASNEPAPDENSESLTSRLAEALRAQAFEAPIHVSRDGSRDVSPETVTNDDVGLFDEDLPTDLPADLRENRMVSQNAFIAAEQRDNAVQQSRGVFASGPTVDRAGVFGHAAQPVDEKPKSRMGTSIKRLAVPEETPRQRARLRRPTAIIEPDADEQGFVHPKDLPPPVQRRGFSVTAPVEVHSEVHSPVVEVSSKRAQKVAAKAEKAERRQQTPAQILDQRAPGNAREDRPFVLPLIPAIIVTALMTHLWFQGAFRLQSILPLFPIVIGTLNGGIMRLGSRSVDFARVIFAIMLTTIATFWGHAAIRAYGSFGELTKANIRWETLPRVPDPTTMISIFRDTAEKSLGTATVMFAGLIAAGLISSLSAK